MEDQVCQLVEQKEQTELQSSNNKIEEEQHIEELEKYRQIVSALQQENNTLRNDLATKDHHKVIILQFFIQFSNQNYLQFKVFCITSEHLKFLVIRYLLYLGLC